MKKSLFILICLLPAALSSYVTITQSITGNQTWTNQTYYINDIHNVGIGVADNAILSIDSGAVIKIAEETDFIVCGSLYVNGTSNSEIIFTSINDNTVGEIISGSTGTPLPGDWDGFYLNGSSFFDGTGEFNYCQIRYGGRSSGTYNGNIYFHYANGYFRNSISEYSLSSGIKIKGSAIEFRENIIRENGGYGVYVLDSPYSTVPNFGVNSNDMGLNSFINNNSGNWQFYNNSSHIINAYYNIWEFTNADSIDAHIYDDNEDPSKGEVLFNPWFEAQLDPPLNVTISTDSDSIYISWEAVINATSYTVFSDLNPNGSFPNTEWTGSDTNWSEALDIDIKKFYYITATD